MRPLEPVMMILVMGDTCCVLRVAWRRKRNAHHGPHSKIYFKRPQVFIVIRSKLRFFALMGTRGRRYSSSIWPIIARAALTGTGLLSMNRSLNSGYHRWWRLNAVRSFPLAYALTICATWRG